VSTLCLDLSRDDTGRLLLQAVLGMVMFGVFNSGANFLLNFRDGWAIRVYLIASATAGYLPLTFGQILLFLKAELRWKVPYSHAHAIPTAATLSSPAPVAHEPLRTFHIDAHFPT